VRISTKIAKENNGKTNTFLQEKSIEHKITK